MIEAYDAYGDSGIADVIVFASGTIESPNVTKIVKIDLTDDVDIETKRRIVYEIERRGIQQKAGELFRFYNKADFLGEFRHQRISDERNGDNNRLNVKRRGSEIKTDPIVEFHVNEESGTITTVYRSGEVVEESLEGGDARYSYTPTKEESNDELLKQYEDGAITREEYLELLRGKTPKDGPVSLANMTPNDFDRNTTPSFQCYLSRKSTKKDRQSQTLRRSFLYPIDQ
jgi:hypothetical protein